MTKSQTWAAAFLAIFILLFFLGRITKNEEPPKPNKTMMGNQSSNQRIEGGSTTGAGLVVSLGCVTCHGNDLNGTKMAPALVNISENWTRDKLINYLRNPSSYMDTDRFKEFKEKYPSTIMPSFNNIDVKELGKIADYLMKR